MFMPLNETNAIPKMHIYTNLDLAVIVCFKLPWILFDTHNNLKKYPQTSISYLFMLFASPEVC